MGDGRPIGSQRKRHRAAAGPAERTTSGRAATRLARRRPAAAPG